MFQLDENSLIKPDRFVNSSIISSKYLQLGCISSPYPELPVEKSVLFEISVNLNAYLERCFPQQRDYVIMGR
jgi:hypothetical protein